MGNYNLNMCKFDRISEMGDVKIYPDKSLRRKTREVKRVDGRLLENVRKISEVLKKSENGAGLAAPQIGLDSRIFAKKDPKLGNISVFINPKIEKTYGGRDYIVLANKNEDEQEKREDFLEGCLSFPGYFGTVKRYLKIDVSWMELEEGHLVKKEASLEGFGAVVFQHETDHLDGVVFVDYIKRDGGKFLKEVGGKMVDWDVDEVLRGNL